MINLVPGTCTVDTVSRAFTFALGAGASLNTSDDIFFEVVATNPATAGLTGTFAISFYSDALATTLIETTTGTGITILAFTHLNSWMLEYKTQMTKVQSHDSGTLTFEVPVTVAVAARTEFI